MPDSRNRYRASRFAAVVSAYLTAWGLNATIRMPGPHKRLSETFAAEPEPIETSTLVGLQRFSVSTRADNQLDLSGALNAAERAAAPDRFGVCIQHRRSPALANEHYAVMSLETFAKVARIVEGLEGWDD